MYDSRENILCRHRCSINIPVYILPVLKYYFILVSGRRRSRGDGSHGRCISLHVVASRTRRAELVCCPQDIRRRGSHWNWCFHACRRRRGWHSSFAPCDPRHPRCARGDDSTPLFGGAERWELFCGAHRVTWRLSKIEVSWAAKFGFASCVLRGTPHPALRLCP